MKKQKTSFDQLCDLIFYGLIIFGVLAIVGYMSYTPQ